jgi:hypothetical protein
VLPRANEERALARSRRRATCAAGEEVQAQLGAESRRASERHVRRTGPGWGARRPFLQRQTWIRAHVRASPHDELTSAHADAEALPAAQYYGEQTFIGPQLVYRKGERGP